jgi:hypothetical protein
MLNFVLNRALTGSTQYVHMAVLSFLFCIVTAGAQPLSLAAGLFVGYLFFKDWKQLAWGLLLFVIPGIGGMDSSTHAHSAFYLAAAQFFAVCFLAFGSFQAFEYFISRRHASKRGS